MTGPAHAEWMQASSDHFLVYADDSEKDLRAFTDQLERYDAAMALLSPQERRKPSPSNRVTIYLVRSDRDVRKLLGEGSKNVAGFYIPRAGGSMAIAPRIERTSGKLHFSMTILLHEYAHHFMISASSFPLPPWMQEGGAEFFASASFDRDGTVNLGEPAQHRAYELFNDGGLTVEDILTSTGNDEKGARFGSFYGKSWLLYHYLIMSDERTGQFTTYERALQSGKGLEAAALEAFGDLDRLERDLNGYLSKRRMRRFSLTADKLTIGPIAIRPLSEGEAAIMPVLLRSKRGVSLKEAKELLVEARAIAAKYPGDPAVLTALAEAEYDAGRDDAAIAAADAALAIDPGQVNAYVQKGYALFNQARRADDKESAYTEAVKPFVALNGIENDHPLPLIYFYRSYDERGIAPPDLAKRGLAWASALAPFDLGLRMRLARQDLRDEDLPQARASLIPIAYNPHGGALADRARALLLQLDEQTDLKALARQIDVEGRGDAPDDAEESLGQPAG